MQDIFKDMTHRYKYLKNTRPIKGLDIHQETCANVQSIFHKPYSFKMLDTLWNCKGKTSTL